METFHCSKQFLNLQISMPFSASAVFGFGWCFFFFFYLSHIGKMFPFEDFFIKESTQKAAQGEIRQIGRVGRRNHAISGQKLLNAAWCGQVNS